MRLPIFFAITYQSKRVVEDLILFQVEAHDNRAI